MIRTPLRVGATLLSVTVVTAVAVPATATAAVTATTATTATPAAASAAAPSSTVAPLRTLRSTHAAGYVRSHVPTGAGSEDVNARFTVPTVACASLPATGGSVSIWAGVDGVLGSSAVNLRAGILISCRSSTATATYQAFWSQAPNPAKIIGTTAPGHQIYVYVSSEDFQPVNVIDETTDDFFAGGSGDYVSDHSSVECLVDAVGRANRTVPLPAFGTIRFSSCDDLGGDPRAVADPATARTGETTSKVQNNLGGVRATTSAVTARGAWNVRWVAAT